MMRLGGMGGMGGGYGMMPGSMMGMSTQRFGMNPTTMTEMGGEVMGFNMNGGGMMGMGGCGGFMPVLFEIELY